jgi:2,3,4,5-tetrahydropyridine-2-carboxylate N-succinyltransferase
MHELQSEIERLYAMGSKAAQEPRATATFIHFRDALTAGQIRAAEKVDGRWRTNTWVKEGILLGFRIGNLTESGDPHVRIPRDTSPPANRYG